MGHKIKRKVFALQFEGHEDLDGATVRVRSVSLGKLFEVAGQAEQARDGKFKLDDVRALFELFTDRLDSWDLEDEDGTPIEQDMDGLLSLDPDVALEIVLTWFDVMISIKRDTDLGKESTSGEQFPEASIPMAVA